MTTSSIAAAVDYLVTAATTAYGTTTHVFDGLPVTGTELTFPSAIYIGYSPVSPDLPIVAGDQEFGPLGARARDERYAIVCAVEYWSGDPTMKPLRDGAFAVLAQVETLLRGTGGSPGDCTLGGAVLFSQISGGIEVHQGQNVNGASVVIQFHISCRARLT